LRSRATARGLALAISVSALVSIPGTARAQDSAEAEAQFRKELDALLDRWNDSATDDRLGKAVTLCEEHLKKSKGDDKAADLETRLELVRLKLAKGDYEGATKEANTAEKAAVSTNSERKNTAKVLYLMSFERSSNERLTRLKGEDQKKGIEDFKKADEELAKNLIESAGTKDAAIQLFQEEDARIRTAMTLNELGKAPKPIDKNGIDEKPIRLADYAGKVVMVDFWATWCGPCMHELPNVLKVYADYHARGLEIVGISLDEDRAKLDATLKDQHVPWRQYFDGKGWGNDIAVAWGVHAIPRTYLIDHTGKVRYVDVRGEGLAAAVKDLVERAEKAQPPKKGD
jgi:thiol-disulfide isomerase/thioredoxin